MTARAHQSEQEMSTETLHIETQDIARRTLITRWLLNYLDAFAFTLIKLTWNVIGTIRGITVELSVHSPCGRFVADKYKNINYRYRT